MTTNLTGTASMEYNSFSQRSWVASVNSKRDIAIEKLKDQLTTKYAELYWSDSTAETIALVQPTGNPSWDSHISRTADNPYSSAIEIFGTSALTPAINPAGDFTNGYAIAYTPPGLTKIFELVGADGLAAGYQQIKYVHSVGQLCEIECQLTFNGANADSHIGMISIRINATDGNTAQYDLPPENNIYLRSVGANDAGGANENSTTLVFKHSMTLNQNDKVKFTAWKNDANGGAIKCTLAKFQIKTLP